MNREIVFNFTVNMDDLNVLFSEELKENEVRQLVEKSKAELEEKLWDYMTQILWDNHLKNLYEKANRG